MAEEANGKTSAEELAIIAPDVDVTVADPDTGDDVTLTLREFRFLEGLKAQAIGAPLIAGLMAVAGEEAAGGEPPSQADIDSLLGEHAEVWLELLARACGRKAAWLARLADEDARAVSGAMWSANGPFFFRRVLEHAAAGKTIARLFPSPESSTPSPPQGTGTTEPSANE